MTKFLLEMTAWFAAMMSLAFAGVIIAWLLVFFFVELLIALPSPN